MRQVVTFIALIVMLSFSVNAVFDYDATKQKSGIVEVLEGNKASLSLDGVNGVELNVVKANEKNVLILLDSKSLLFNIGDIKEVDLDNDGVNDVDLILDSIVDKVANFKIQKLVNPTIEENVVPVAEEDLDEAEDSDEDDVEDLDEAEEETTAGQEVKDAGKSLTGAFLGVSSASMKWIVGAIIAIVIIVVVIFVARDSDKPERFYGKAMDLHREGQEFHWEGDDDTADELYDKAKELREKARNMEGGL